MKFFALAALVATTQAAGTIATGADCTGKTDADCATATDSCCFLYTEKESTTKVTGDKKACGAKGDGTAGKETSTGSGQFFDKACAGRTAGAASLAATAAAAATALYAMC